MSRPTPAPPRTRSFTPLLFPALAAFLFCGNLPAADDPTVLDPADAPGKMLYQALEREARELLEARRKEVAALKTPEAIRERQGRILGKFREALGDFPEKTPLNARVVGRDRRDGYSVERLIYESRPGHHVTAVLYLPDGDAPVPGVLVPCGHSANGKAAETYQRACIVLARNGMAALCYDPIGQGERVQALDDKGKPRLSASTAEHTMAGIGALLVGRSTASYRVWDGIRSLDYLASRPEVDPKRLGCTGNSGGGTMTAYLMALDDRIAAAAPSCYITSLERLFATIGPQDAEQNITGQVAFGMDHADYVTMRAPRPTLLSVGTQDFFDIQGSWDTFREAKLVYGRLGHGERVDLFESDEKHGFTRPRREAAMRWLRRWLLKIDDAPVEPDFPIATDAQLQCTETGQVLTSFRETSVFDLNAERADELARARDASIKAAGKDKLLAEVRRLIGLRTPARPARRDGRGTVEAKGYTIRKLAFETDQGIVLPALLFDPEKGDAGKPLRIVVGYDPSSEARTRVQIAEPLVKEGSRVLFVDLRGQGETTPKEEGARPGPFGPDWKEAFLALHLDRPLLGQRVGDLLAVIAAMEGEASARIGLVALGTSGEVALHATALEPKFGSAELSHMPASWTAIARSTLTREPLANVVPGALATYDLPDLAALVAPRPLAIRASIDAEGRPLESRAIEAAYAPARTAYIAEKAADRLRLEAGPALPTRRPLLRAVDLSVGETRVVTLSNGKAATIKLVELDERRDPIRSAVREAKVKVEVNGKPLTLSSGNYNLPVTVGGVQVDCPITGGYRSNSNSDPWALEKDARFRLWPAGSPWLDPTTFQLPARQRWFSSNTQMANEPSYVDGGEKPSVKKVYYHYGLDMGGAEGTVPVVAATDGLVVSAGTDRLAGFEETPASPRYDVVYVVDDRGWYYRYSHLQTIDPAVKPGATVRMGQPIGVLGKEGGSGGWSHLHFDITSRQPSGRWGIEEGYAFLWQTVLREQKPEVIAVARPHRLAWAGEPVELDASKSWSRTGPIARFAWSFGDGTLATGPRVEHTYDRPGVYSEVVRVTDRRGHVDFDFAIVQVLDRSRPQELPPTIHAAYAPSTGIKPGDPVTFKVRTFRTTDGHETWDFGDGTPKVEVHSDGNVDQHARDGYAVTTHAFATPGRHLVSVERTDRRGATATARLQVVVEGEPEDR